MRRIWLLSLLIAAPLAAQVATPFRIRVQEGSNISTVAPGATIPLAAAATGVAATARVTLTYTGTTLATVSNISLFGSSAFTLTAPGSVDLEPTQEMTFEVRYLPANSQASTGQVVVGYVEVSSLPGQPNPRGSLGLTLAGTAPEFVLAYSLETNNNVVPLANGGRISYPATPLGGALAATITIVNRGSGAADVRSVVVNGEGFQLLGLALLPAVVPAGQELRFGLRFTPQQIGPHTGSVAITLGTGPFTATLDGSGAGSVFSYEVTNPDGSGPVAPDQTIALPDAALGSSSTVTMIVRNTGNANGQVSFVAATPTVFQVADLPVLPVTLSPGASFLFTIGFTPTQAGTSTGRLRIGNESFNLSGRGIGVALSLSYAPESGPLTPVGPGGTVIFTPTQVGSSSSARFVLRNAGTLTGTVTSLSIGTGLGIYTLADQPALPLTIAPEQEIGFRVVFAPTVPGTTTGVLIVDAVTFSLSGAASPPPPLPSYRFDGASGAVQPLEQPAIGLLLDEPYPIALTGILTLQFNSDVFSTDPALQFSTGGTTAAFTIPAGGTRAVFINGSNELKLQTGTVAGTIVLTPSFSTTAGLNLTPPSPARLQMTLARSVPRLLSGVLASLSATSATLTVTGYTTSRSLQRLAFQFGLVPNPPASVPSTQFTLDIAAAADLWFRNSGSTASGGLFSATIPFTFQGAVTGVPAFIEIFQSVTVTATSELGQSNPVTVNLR